MFSGNCWQVEITIRVSSVQNCTNSCILIGGKRFPKFLLVLIWQSPETPVETFLDKKNFNSVLTLHKKRCVILISLLKG
jgi:hypothetical protein